MLPGWITCTCVASGLDPGPPFLRFLRGSRHSSPRNFKTGPFEPKCPRTDGESRVEPSSPRLSRNLIGPSWNSGPEFSACDWTSAGVRHTLMPRPRPFEFLYQWRTRGASPCVYKWNCRVNIFKNNTKHIMLSYLYYHVISSVQRKSNTQTSENHSLYSIIVFHPCTLYFTFQIIQNIFLHYNYFYV